MARLPADKRRQVGTRDDGCGAQAKVYQNTKGHLYTVCPNCGCNQAYGVVPQTEMYRSLVRLPGVDMTRPPNVLAGVEPVGTVPAETAAAPEVQEDYTPDEPPTGTAPAAAAPEVKKGRGKGAGLVLLFFGVLGFCIAGAAGSTTR